MSSSIASPALRREIPPPFYLSFPQHQHRYNSAEPHRGDPSAAPLPLSPSRPLPGGAAAPAVYPLLRVTAAAVPVAIATYRLACGPSGDGGGRRGSSRARYGHRRLEGRVWNLLLIPSI